MMFRGTGFLLFLGKWAVSFAADMSETVEAVLILKLTALDERIGDLLLVKNCCAFGK
jgi:hypothetical protein